VFACGMDNSIFTKFQAPSRKEMVMVALLADSNIDPKQGQFTSAMNFWSKRSACVLQSNLGRPLFLYWSTFQAECVRQRSALWWQLV
jgi:hypothetical protein